MTRFLLLGLLISALNVWSAEREVVALIDPPGDDNGNGALVYPQRDDFRPGDLDLVSLRIIHTGAAYRFEATFRNPVRDPATVAGDVGPESLAYFARRGFYAMNLDIYLDLDRVPGSGSTYTLPGRHAAIDASHAWEKAVILTPRPELMRQQLVDAVAQSEGADDSAAVATRLDRSILFPTEVSVRHRTIAFLVPEAFLAGGRPDTQWSITAFVTGARTSIATELALDSAPGTALERLPLGVLQPRAGRPRDTFGYSGAASPGPVVDLLAPAPLSQPDLLAGTTALPGIAWTASEPASATDHGTPETRITHTTAAPPPAAPSSIGDPHSPIADRLRQLNELRAQGLIDEQEYAELRRRILADL